MAKMREVKARNRQRERMEKIRSFLLSRNKKY